MWFRKPLLLLAALLAVWAAGSLGCHLEPDEETYLDIRADSTWLAHDSVSVMLADSTGRTLEVLRHGPLDSLEQLDRLEARQFSGGRTVLILIAYQDGLAVRRESRTYDGGSQTTVERKVEKDVDVLNPGKVPRLDLGPDTLKLYRGGAPAVLKPAPAGTWEGKSLDWSTSDAGVAMVSRGLVTPVGAGTARIRARSGSSADSVTVTVVADVPVLSAGKDTVVQAHAFLAFRVTVAQEHGGIALFKWSLDGDTAWDDSLRGFPESQAVLVTDARHFALPGQYALHFLVEDGEGNRAMATRQLTVTGVPVPQPPIAYAGSDFVVKAGYQVTLIGSASDPDGTIVSREWRSEGSSVPLWSTDTYVFHANAIGVHRYVYQVFDEDGLSASDTVQVMVKPVSDDRPPVIFGIQVENDIPSDGNRRSFMALVRGNGKTLTYSWDYDGDGLNDEISMVATKANGEVDSLMGYFRYAVPGEYWAGLRITDSDGLAAIGGIGVSIAASGNTGLSSFLPDAGVLFPEFSPEVHEYWVQTMSSQADIRFTASSQSAYAFLTVNGEEIGNGTLSQSFALQPGSNFFYLDVHNPTGEVITYIITVQRGIFFSGEQPRPPGNGTF